MNTRSHNEDAPGPAATGPEGETTNPTISGDQEIDMSSIPDPTDDVQDRALDRWGAFGARGRTLLPFNAPDPVAAGLPAPIWDWTETRGVPRPTWVETNPAERYWCSPPASVPLTRYRGTPLDGGRSASLADASISIRQNYLATEPVVHLSRRSYKPDAAGDLQEELVDLLELRPAEARDLAAVLTTAAELADPASPEGGRCVQCGVRPVNEATGATTGGAR